MKLIIMFYLLNLFIYQIYEEQSSLKMNLHFCSNLLKNIQKWKHTDHFSSSFHPIASFESLYLICMNTKYK